MHVLVLGGTTEGRRVAELLHGGTHRVTSSLAGRVASPRRPPGVVRTGGFGGVAGLVRWLRAHQVDVLVDATHPFAATISRNAAEAAARAGVPLLAVRRPGWRPTEGDDWRRVGSLAEAAAALPTLGRRIFLTTGRTGLAAFATLDTCWFLVRTVDPPSVPDQGDPQGPSHPPHMQVLLDRGPFTLDGERALLHRHRIDVLVTKDSGGQATAPKLIAAREAHIPVVLITRPPTPEDIPTVQTPEEAVTWLTTPPPHTDYSHNSGN